MPFSRRVFVFFLGLLWASHTHALTWQATTIESRTEPFQKALTLTFAFKNTDDRRVAILDLQTDCSCITASADKKTYAPGESGLVTAQFALDDRSGLYERHLTVVTDESTPAQRLVVHIEVPELATLSPPSLEWRLNEEAVEKVIEVRTAESLRITFTQATLTNDTFIARLETITVGQIYQLVVTPRSTAAVTNAAIRIHGHEVLVSAYANVR